MTLFIHLILIPPVQHYYNAYNNPICLMRQEAQQQKRYMPQTILMVVIVWTKKDNGSGKEWMDNKNKNSNSSSNSNNKY